MPVRGHGWYKRPYRLRVTYDRSKMTSKDGPKTQSFAFHWPGPRDESAKSYRRMGHVTNVEVWDEPVDAVQVRV